MEDFPIILKQERIKNKYTQKELAQEIGVTERAYRNYESLGVNFREPTLKTLIKIAEVLDVSVDYLLGK